MIEHLTLLEL